MGGGWTKTAKSLKLEQTVVDLYAELEWRDSELETEAKNSRLFRQEVETKLRDSEVECTKLKDMLRDAEERLKELEQSLETGEKHRIETQPESLTGDGTKQDTIVDKYDSESGRVGKHPILGSRESSDGVVQPKDDDMLTERYAAAVKKIQSLQRDLRHSEARHVELEDNGALLRQQLTDMVRQRDETTVQLTDKVEQLTAQLDAAEERLQQLKTLTEDAQAAKNRVSELEKQLENAKAECEREVQRREAHHQKSLVQCRDEMMRLVGAGNVSAVPCTLR